MDNARYQRFTKDACLIRIFNLPAAGTTASSDTINLGDPEVGPMVHDFDVRIEIDPTPNLADGKNLTFTLVHSEDGTNFVPVPYIAPVVVTGAGGAGAVAQPAQFGLPASVNQYLRLAAQADAAAGDSTAATAELSLVF